MLQQNVGCVENHVKIHFIQNNILFCEKIVS